MLRGTIYIINSEGVPRDRVVRACARVESFPRVMEAAMTENGELRQGERLEFGPIGEPWGPAAVSCGGFGVPVPTCAHGQPFACVDCEADHRSRWRPIGTAPKDGKRVIAWGPRLAVAECEWLERYGGWYRSNQSPQVHPTHWMPLPAPPEGQ